MDLILLVATLGVLPLLWMFWSKKRQKDREQLTKKSLHKSIELGLNEPISLHPKIDSNICIGSGACVEVCPEGEVLGFIDGRPELINPSACIGHGECLRNCPVSAIGLYLGTEKRGVDLPLIYVNFETNVSGIFIAGELGGMGLIRNAITQGRQAVESIAKNRTATIDGIYDLLIVGAGPAGIGASLAAMKAKLNFITIDQSELGGTVLSYPRHKIVMTAPVDLPIYGKIKLRETTKEALLDFWQEVIRKTGLQLNLNEKVNSVDRDGDSFKITTSKKIYRSKKVLLAIGRRGTPRKLGIPGEELPKVTYHLLEPENFANSRCLVVGGGDSAIEAAMTLSAQPNCEVTLSYRRSAFGRVKPKNRDSIGEAVATGKVNLILNSNLKEIRSNFALIFQGEKELELENDYVFIFIGGELPNAFLKKMGVEFETVHGKKIAHS